MIPFQFYSVAIIKHSDLEQFPWRVKGLFGLYLLVTLHHQGKPGQKIRQKLAAETMEDAS